jgi:trigger factor
MQTTLEQAGRHTVRLSVEVPADEVARDLDRAYRKVSSEVRIPGFRQGKVPRRIIDARIGREHVLHEFVEESLPSYYLRALREHALAPIADPEIDVELEELRDGQPLRFTATVEVRPRLTLEPESYRGIRVDAPSAEPTEAEVDQYLDRLRERFAELEVVGRPARPGDFAIADVRASMHGTEIPEATAQGFMTEIGTKDLVPELDRELEGKRPGDILKFNAVLPEGSGERAGQEATFSVLVKEVKAKRLPPLDDDFARTASEFDSMAELREDVRAKLGALKAAESRAALRDLVLRRVVDAMEVDLPDRLVDDETERRVESARERTARSGVDLETVLQEQGWDELRFRSDARAHAIRALKADLVLEAVARQEDIQVEPEELEREVRELARDTGKSPKEVRRLLERSGQVTTLAGDIIRTKALDLIVEQADISSKGAPARPEPERTHDQGDGDE